MQTVFIQSKAIADELIARGYKLSKNKALRVDGAFVFDADNSLVELLKSAYNNADYLIDPLQRYDRHYEENV